MSNPVQQAPALGLTGLATNRTYTIRRSTALGGLLLLALTTAWSCATGWYILRKDDLAARLIARETSRQYAYEDRIAALRADVDRLASRALIDQDGVEARVAELATRQAEIENKQALVASIADTLQAGGLTASLGRGGFRPKSLRPSEPAQASGASPGAPSGVSSFAPVAPLKPTPIPDPAPPRRADDKPVGPWQQGGLGEERPAVPPALRLRGELTKLAAALAETDAAQIEALREIEGSLAASQRSLRGALSETGLDIDRLTGSPDVTRGLGGPFVPFRIDPSAGPFEATLHAIQPRIGAVIKLKSLARQLPLQRPMKGEADMTSNFGYRVDPFTRGPAMHTGIDFRAETGSPIKATAPGKVVTAEYSGGYGNMVEVEHAGGVATRYAHMSAITVSVGQSVDAGTVVGRVGSTGRSTGPHLHYETRIDGDAVDPARFLRAGAKLDGKAF